MNLTGRDSFTSVGWKDGICSVGSHHFSIYMMLLFRDGLLSSTIVSLRTSVAFVLCHLKYDPAADPHIKLLIRAFRLERPVQWRIMPKWNLHLVLLALMSPPLASEVGYQAETSDDIIPLKWRTMKNSVPASFGNGETTFISTCLECHSWQVCVFERKHPASTDVISVTGSRVSCQKPATVAGSAMDFHVGYSTSQHVWVRTDVLPC